MEFMKEDNIVLYKLQLLTRGLGEMCLNSSLIFQMMLAEKEHGLQRLNSCVEAGERLYPDTAAAGREKVRQTLRSAKEDWERLFSALNDTQRRVDNFLLQWSSYAEGQDQLQRWLGDTEASLRADLDLKNTLQEKRMQLQNSRVCKHITYCEDDLFCNNEKHLCI